MNPPHSVDGRYQKTVLPNGVKVLTESLPHVRSVSVGIWVNSGSRDERPEQTGISHFIEHMIFKGTDRLSPLAIARAFDQMGGLSNAFTSKENTCFHAKVLDVHAGQVMDLLADMFLNSVFDAGEFERERQVILQEIGMVEDSPDELIHDLFGNFFWHGTGLGRPILGTEASVEALGPDNLRRHVRDIYVGSRVLVTAAGNVGHEVFVERIARLFEGLAARGAEVERAYPGTSRGMNAVVKNLEQAHLLMGFEGPASSAPSRYATSLLNVVLGGSMSSRLFQEIREKRGLAYSVYSFLSGYEDTGLLGLYAGMAPAQTSTVAALMMGELARLAREPMHPSEIEAAREHIQGSLLLAAESTDTRMSRLAKNEITQGRPITYEETLREFASLTPEAIQEAAAACLKQRPALVCLGPIPDAELKACEGLVSA